MSGSSPPRRRRRRITALVVVSVLTLAVTAFAVFGMAGGESPDRPAPPRAAGAGNGGALDDLSKPRGGEGAGRRAAAAKVPAFGMMAWQANRLGPADFALLRSGGSRYYRFNLLTSTSGDRERGPATKNYDRLIGAGVTQGIEFLPVLLRSRTVRGGRKPGQVAVPPETPREWATWRTRVRFFAERYGPRGAFWSENPELPYRPLRAWEIWNEPNLRQFWDRRKVNPREYGRLLRETRTVLRDVDPEARIVSAGLAARYKGARYLSAALAEAGACTVDAIGIHPYAPSVPRSMQHLSEARRAADRRGAKRVPLWTTEIGWKVGGRGYSNVPNARVQARNLGRFAAATDRRRRELALGPSFAFALRDRKNMKTGKVDSTVGLRRADNRPRPSWAVWARAARAAPELALPPVRRCRGDSGS